MNRKQCWAKLLKFSLSISMALPFAIHAQEEDGEIYDLSPFSVEASDNEGYMAQTTLAGSRVRSDIRDLGSSISIVTKDFMEDTAGTDAQSLLYLVGNVEVGGVLGNYANVDTFDSSTQESRLTPQRGQRIRGLVSANLTRDYFQSDIAFDAYNTSRVTVNRGPNSILFGLGSPGGVINNTTNKAVLGEEFGELSIRVDNNNGHRETLDFNKTLIKDRLAIRVNLLNQNQRFRQEEAFSDDTRFFIAWNAVLLKNEGSDVFGATRFRGSYENGEIYSNPPDVVPPVDRFSSWWNGVGTQEDANRLLSVPGVTLSEIGDGSISNAQVLSAISSGLVTVPAGMTAEEYAAIEGRFVPQTTVHTFKRSDPNDPSWGGEKNVSWRDMYYLYPALNVDSVTSQERGYNDPALAGIQGIFGRWRPFVGGDINRNVTQDVIWTNSLYEQKTSTLGGAGFTETSLNDRNVFDYHKHLFSGTTNFIEKDFDIKQFFLEQELFGGKAGFEIAWDDQSSEQTDRNPLDRLHFKAIHIDISEFERPGNEDFTAGLIANENVGRPVVLLDDDNLNRRTDDQETFRATGMSRK